MFKITQKRPNFSKINKGDFLYVEEKSCEGECENYGYFDKIEGDFFVLDKFNNKIMQQTIKKSNITKIMRIDIEKKHIEEI